MTEDSTTSLIHKKNLPHDDAVGSIPMKEVYKLNGPLTRNVRIMVVTLEVYAC